MSTPDPRQLAVERRDQALREAARWSDFVAMYDELHGAQQAATVSHDTGATDPTTRQHIQPRSHNAPPVRRSVVAIETAEAARKVILMAGRPLHTRDVLSRLIEAGHEVGGKDPKATLFSRLVRAPGLLRFDKIVGWNAVVEPPLSLHRVRRSIPPEGSQEAEDSQEALPIRDTLPV